MVKEAETKVSTPGRQDGRMNAVKLTDITANLALNDREIIGIYGAGGKTTLLYRLAQELAGLQKRVLVTTTTKIYQPEKFHTIVSLDYPEAREMLRTCFDKQKVVVLGSALLSGNKMQGIDRTWPERFLHDGVVDYVLVEADGAAGKAIKGYADHEPVLPVNATLLLPLIGLDALGSKLVAEQVHRPEHLAGIVGALPGQRLTEKHLCLCMAHMVALGRSQVSGARLISIFNKSDLVTDKLAIRNIAESAASVLATDQLLFTAIQESESIRFAFRRKDNEMLPRLACVVLAAGSARRMGEDKLCLELDGKPLLAHAVENALASGIDQVVVVTRPGSNWVHRLFTDSRVKVVINHRTEEGQSSSVRVGLQSVEPLTQAVFFALGDQPFIRSHTYQRLQENYLRYLKPIVCPVFKGQRGNPVLFDRQLFSQLMQLKGDAGGKQLLNILALNNICTVETNDAGILVDIDTPEDRMKYNLK